MSSHASDEHMEHLEQQQGEHFYALGTKNGGHASSSGDAGPRTACFNCRAVRQKCDRRIPWRGRVGIRTPPTVAGNKEAPSERPHSLPGKPETAEKLLARIKESAVRDEVIAGLLGSQWARSQAPLSPRVPSPPLLESNSFNGTHGISASTATASVVFEPSPGQHSRPDLKDSLVSPLHILAAAVAADPDPTCHGLGSRLSTTYRSKIGRKDMVDPKDERLASYFAPQTLHKRDWQVLATQSIDMPLKLEPTTCDPITANLIDLDDVAYYFKLFYDVRNPLVGLLDPGLHTPEFVYEASFTLFSVVCALGCAISSRPRDRVLYPALINIAEGTMKWSIATSVKTVETIQAIINLQYWAPIRARQSDDPYWLYLSHATQLAREIGINNPSTVAELVNAVSPNGSPEFREQLSRNFERTWLYTFIADKSFGLSTGRSPGVHWRELPAAAPEWWRKPMTTNLDQMVSGIALARELLLEALEQRNRIDRTAPAILHWHTHAFEALESSRSSRCTPSDPLSATFHSVLAFYMDHNLLVLNAQALRDLSAIDDSVRSAEFSTITHRTVAVANRVLDLVLLDKTFREMALGFHNNQFIMICHASTEVIHAVRRGCLTSAEAAEAAARVRAIPLHLEKTARNFHACSVSHLYIFLSRFFACQLDKLLEGDTGENELGRSSDQDFPFAEWWGLGDNVSLDTAAWLDMGFLGSQQPLSGVDDSHTTGPRLDDFMIN
ncbi:unnamed protein product [Clonostachys rhizophaga]|uniref:Xylanolytic transcriptional activator regulatory domain-containing protein n=1 Tax=Clonostachys rhizophaga TaxID=160324 RepID=A0A9N9YQK5_9HYPO|nr:unnamed protein product [Clonostachys rhizophaga]